MTTPRRRFLCNALSAGAIAAGRLPKATFAIVGNLPDWCILDAALALYLKRGASEIVHIPNLQQPWAAPHRARPLPPGLREKGLYIRHATLRRHPLLGVEAILITGLLRVVYRHLAPQRLHQWPKGSPVQQGARRSRHE